MTETEPSALQKWGAGLAHDIPRQRFPVVRKQSINVKVTDEALAALDDIVAGFAKHAHPIDRSEAVRLAVIAYADTMGRAWTEITSQMAHKGRRRVKATP